VIGPNVSLLCDRYAQHADLLMLSRDEHRRSQHVLLPDLLVWLGLKV
jgi:hypothetical protein